MYLPYHFLCPEKAEQPYFLRKRLSKKKNFGLEAGEYLIYDLFPMSPFQGDALYFNLVQVKTQQIILTAYYDPVQTEIAISHCHLQSAKAPEALNFLIHALDAKALDKLADRQDDALELYAYQLAETAAEDPEEFEVLIKELDKLGEHSVLAAEVHDYIQMLGSLLNQTQSLEGFLEAEDGAQALNNLIEFPGARTTAAPKKQKKIQGKQTDSLTVRVDLLGAKPPIWRRLQIPAALNLTELHEVLQIAMGWENYHLWQFVTPEQEMYMPDDADSADPNTTCIGELLHVKNDVLVYDYDFGDNWQHRIQLEKRERKAAPVQLLKAVNACPPEDCGGIWGYAEILKMLKKKRKNAQDRELLEWLGGDFDPQHFELKKVNQQLNALKLDPVQKS